jgi:hypothetical protein
MEDDLLQYKLNFKFKNMIQFWEIEDYDQMQI